MALDLNPVLDEIDRLSPEAKSALQQAHTTIAGAPATAATTPQVSQPAAATPAPAVRPMPAPGAAPMIRGLGPAPTSATPPAPSPIAAAHTAELGRLTTGDTGKSGIAQIKNPWARIPLQIADAIGGGLFPGIEQRLPGTEGHHQLLVREAQRDVANDEAQAAEEAKNAETAALGNEANARAYSLEHPTDKNIGQTITTNKGIMQWNPETQMYDIPAGEAPEKQVTPQHVVTNDGRVLAITTDPKTHEVSAKVVYQGDPKRETTIANLEVNGKPHQVLVDKNTGETIKDLGEGGIKPPTVNVNAGTAALDRESTRFAKTWEKNVSDANSQLEKINEAQSMINGNAESQALGIPKVLTALISGQGTGVRITQAELNGIGHARGISGDVEGALRKMSGKGQLTPEQQHELNGVLEDAKRLVLMKQQIANDALDAINSGENREAIINADKEARKKLADLQAGKTGAPAAQQWEATATGKDGHKIGFRGGKWYDIQTGKELK